MNDSSSTGQACPFGGCTTPLREGDQVAAMHFGASGPPTIHENEETFSYVHASHVTAADWARATRRVIILAYRASLMAPGATCRRCGVEGQTGGMCDGCRTDLAEGTTVAQYAGRVLDMIRQDAGDGTVPAEAVTFSEMYEHTDPNVWLAEARLPHVTDEDMALMDAVHIEIDRQLPALMTEIRREQGITLGKAAEAGWDHGMAQDDDDKLDDDDPSLAELIAAWGAEDAAAIDYMIALNVRELLPQAERYLAARS